MLYSIIRNICNINVNWVIVGNVLRSNAILNGQLNKPYWIQKLQLDGLKF